MKKQQVIALSGIVLLVIVILAALYLLSPLSKEIYRASFKRNFIENYIVKEKESIDIGANSFYFAEYSDEKLYLGNLLSPTNLLTVNATLKDTAQILLGVGLDSVIAEKYFKPTILLPNYYMANGVWPIILKGDTNTWKAIPFVSNAGCYFTEAVCIGYDNFVLKSFSAETKEYELVKKTSQNCVFHNDILEKQVDGIFCVDGKLLFNKKRKQVIYLYSYRNQFIVADTNLNVEYRGHTIDTFSRAQVKVARIGVDSKSMLGAPPVMINGLSCTDGDYLFIQSNLLAKNENIKQFKSGSTIDIYSLIDGNYLGSFHLSSYKNQQLTAFQVSNSKLFALFGNYLVSYALENNILSKSKI